MEEIRKLLVQIGLHKNEVSTYCALLQLGEATILEIAQFSGLKRPTVYNTIKNLINRGLIIQLIARKKRYSVGSVEAIKELIQRQQKTYFDVLPALTALQNVPRGTKPAVRYYEGITQITTLYQTLIPQLNMGETLYTAASMRDILRFMPKIVLEFDALAAKNQWHIHELLPANKVGLEYTQSNRNYKKKLLPQGCDLFDNNFMVIGNRVLMVSTGSTPYALVIEDKTLARSLTSLFAVVWNSR